MTTTTSHPYEITVEDAGPARKRVHITVPAASVSTKLQESMGLLMNQTAIPGFRKGKVPTHILEKRFGESLREEARNEIISEAWSTAVEEHGLRTLGDPEPVGDSAEVKIEDGKPLTILFEVEVMPEFELPTFDDIELLRPMIEVTSDHIDEEIEQQKIRHGNLEDVSGQVTEGEFLIGPTTVHLNGSEEVFYKTEQTRLTVPPKDEGGQIVGLHIDTLGAILNGAAVGDEIKIQTVGPDEHELEDVRGANVEITFSVVQASRIIPLSEEDLMSFFGLDSKESLRDQLKIALERRRDLDQASVLRRQATEILGDRIEMELPEKTTAMQADRDLQRMRTDLQSSGRLTLEEVEKEVAKARSGSAEESKKRLKMFFILMKLAEHFHITVNEQEINARIAEIAQQHGTRPEEMKNTLAQQGQLSQIEAVIKEDKAADQLVAACTKKDVSVQEWQKLQESKSSSIGTEPKKKSSTEKNQSKKKKSKKTTSKS